MDSPRICIAGLDVEAGKHLRPVSRRALPLTRSLLAEADGPFELGAVVELGEAKPQPDRPEVEDVLFDPRKAKRLHRLSEEEYATLIDGASQDSLEDAFGPDLQRRGWKYAVDEGEGESSLGCVRPNGALELEIDERFGEKLQLRFEDAEGLTYAPVNDLRFYEADHRTLRYDVVKDVADRLRSGVGVWILFGLARAFKARNDSVKRHWLQVNGFCLEDAPLGTAS